MVVRNLFTSFLHRKSYRSFKATRRSISKSSPVLIERLEDRTLLSFSSIMAASGYELLAEELAPPPTTDVYEQAPDAGLAALIPVAEGEPAGVSGQNDSVGTAQFIPTFGTGPLRDAAADLSGSLAGGDRDFYSFNANAGDVIGAAVTGAAGRLQIFNANGTELIGSRQDVTFIHPADSPLPGGGTQAALSYVMPASGTYTLAVSQGTGTYLAQLRAFRPGLEEQPAGSVQTIFLDFDGATVNTSIFGRPNSNRSLAPLSSFLSGWGLSGADENAVIDSILSEFERSFSTDIRLTGNNGDFDATGLDGEFDVEILNSRDHADPFGDPNVSRIIIGGTRSQLGINTIGIAESIDVGNFDTTETGIVLLDLLSGPAFSSSSLNRFALAPSATIVDLIGVGVGNIAAHEAGHISGTWHTNQFNSAPNIMDQGGNLPGLIGIGPDNMFGTADDVPVTFGIDVFVGSEGFTGSQDTRNAIAFGLSTGTFVEVIEFPKPLDPVDPPGSLVHNGSLAADIGEVGEADSYFVNIDPGQTMTLVMESVGSLQGRVELYDPNGTLIAEATASEAGGDVVLQAVHTTVGGTYEVIASGVSNGNIFPSASVRTFSDEASFLTEAGNNLAFEDFEGIAPFVVATLDSNTNAGPISPGDIPEGVRFRTASTQLFLAPAGYNNQPDIVSDSLFAAGSGSPLIVDFDPGVTAIGSDLISYINSANIEIIVERGDGSMETFQVQPPQNSPGYFGIIVDDGEIVQMRYDPPLGFTNGIDNFHFGQAPVAGTGEYTLSLLLNAAVEEEAHGGPANGNTASAQDLEGGFVNLIGAGERAGVVGDLGVSQQSAGALGRLFGYDASANVIREYDPNTALVINSFPSPVSPADGSDVGLAITPTSLLVGGASGSGLFELNPNNGSVIRTLGDLNFDISGLAFLNNEIYMLTEAIGGTINVLDYDTGSIVRRFIDTSLMNALGASEDALYGIIGSTLFQLDTDTRDRIPVGTISGPGSPGGLGIIGNELFLSFGNQVRVYDLDTLVLKRSMGGPGFSDLEALGADGGLPISDDAADVFSFDLQAGQFVTVVAEVIGDSPAAVDFELEILDADGNVLAGGESGRTNVDQFIEDFQALADGTYFARILSEQALDYSLIVTRNATFELEAEALPIQMEELLVNGSFESRDFTGWTTVTTAGTSRPWRVTPAGQGVGFGMAPTQPQDGEFVAWNGFDGAGPMEFQLYQDVTIGSEVEEAILSWQERIQWNFNPGEPATVPRTFDVEIRDPNTNATLASLFTFSTGTQAENPTGDTGWQTHSVDVSQFIGQTIRVFFGEVVPQRSTGPGQVEIDAISLTATTTASTATFDFEEFTPPPQLVTSLSATRGDLEITITHENGIPFDVERISNFPPYNAAFDLNSFSASTSQGGVLNPGGFIIDFSQAVNDVRIDLGDGGGDVDTLELIAYSDLGGTGTVLGQDFGTLAGGSGFRFDTLSVSAEGIRSIFVIGGSPSAPNSVFYDNLTLTLPPVELQNIDATNQVLGFVGTTDMESEVIVNGGFETGDLSGWTITNSRPGSGNWTINDGNLDPDGPATPLPPISGSYDAIVTQTGFGLRQLAQSFEVPENVASATLSWSDRIQNHASEFSDPDHEFRVLLLDSAGNLIQEVFSTNPGDPLIQIGPNERSFDVAAALEPFAGQTVQLAFEEHGSLFFFNVTVDDVSLVIGSSSFTGQVVTETITFDELPPQPIDDVTIGNVTFDFKRDGVDSTSASFGVSNGPGTTNNLEPPFLIGSAAGILMMDFASPVTSLQFGFALSSLNPNPIPEAILVSLFDADDNLIDAIPVTSNPDPSFTGGLFHFSGAEVGRAVLDFNQAVAGSFVLDNIVTTVGTAITDDVDEFEITLAAGETIQISTATPAGGPGEFLNELDPVVELLDEEGNILAADDNTAADGRNAFLIHTAEAGGRLIIRVTGAEMSAGTYVLNVNRAPVVNDGDLSLSPAVIQEGDSVRLTGTFADANFGRGHTVLVDWGDGTTTEAAVDQDANTFTAMRTFLDDDLLSGTPSDTFAVVVTITDDQGLSDSATTPLTVQNVAPAITSFVDPAPIDAPSAEGEAVTLSLDFTDVGILDEHTVTIGWGDGESDVVVLAVGDRTLTIDHTYQAGGIYEIGVAVTDDDTGSDSFSTSAYVTGIGLQVVNGENVLYVIGGAGEDDVSVDQPDKGSIRVYASFISDTDGRTFDLAGVDRLVAVLGEGDDHFHLAGNITLPTLIDAGAGNDDINGGAGSDILLGGDGDDHLNGGRGLDILIGGDGEDHLIGGPDDDLLFAGIFASTPDDAGNPLESFEEDRDDLLAVQAAWNTPQRDVSERVAEIESLDDFFAKLFDDEEDDSLMGASGTDWFLLFDGDEATDAKGKHSSDIITGL